ncbi:hypothetical protein [Spirillospora sp. NPDC047279]|uniref:hypothetical protein n=1 Tax=Spirillospora sp. NPDC047279 TaxID=3155478 RepID=UPI0033BFEDB6
MSLQFQAIAVLSTATYFAGQVYFKLATAEMPALAGNRPWQLARTLLGNRTWIAGAGVLAVGAGVQTVALTGLSPLQAQPMFLAGLAMLLVLAIPVMGERLTPREWGCVMLLAVAAVLFAESDINVFGTGTAEAARPAGGTAELTSATSTAPMAEVGSAVPAALIVAVALPSLLVPFAAFLASDLSRKGTHAKPLTGVALAVNVGLLTGTAELMLDGAAGLLDDPRALLAAPYLYIFAITTPLALGQLQIALQRSRLVIIGLVATATAKTYLFLLATLLYRQPWPDEHRAHIMAALVLSVLAIAAVPHHEAPALRRPRALTDAPTGTGAHER